MSERRVVRSIDLFSAVRVTFALSASLWAIAVVGLVALYLLGLVSGRLGGVEGFIASLGFTGFTILPFLLGFIVLGALVSGVVALLAGVVVLLYNHIHPLVGGIVVHTRQR